MCLRSYNSMDIPWLKRIRSERSSESAGFSKAPFPPFSAGHGASCERENVWKSDSTAVKQWLKWSFYWACHAESLWSVGWPHIVLKSPDKIERALARIDSLNCSWIETKLIHVYTRPYLHYCLYPRSVPSNWPKWFCEVVHMYRTCEIAHMKLQHSILLNNIEHFKTVIELVRFKNHPHPYSQTWLAGKSSIDFDVFPSDIKQQHSFIGAFRFPAISSYFHVWFPCLIAEIPLNPMAFFLTIKSHHGFWPSLTGPRWSSRAVLQGPRRSRRSRWRRWLRPESGRQISWHRNSNPFLRY